MAIQLIINKELGLAKKRKSNSRFVYYRGIDGFSRSCCLLEFDRITERGGVLELWKRCTNVQNSRRKFVLRNFETYR
jgi:hypothetical protein